MPKRTGIAPIKPLGKLATYPKAKGLAQVKVPQTGAKPQALPRIRMPKPQSVLKPKPPKKG